MNYLKYVIINIIETLLRAFPIPCKTGLIKIGHPDENSPVFLTCNYHLTVERVKSALKGMNAYLLVANTKGDNVWCSATGGHFTNHSVVSVLKTSGIENLVKHKRVILPQLAATGIEGKIIQKKTGWKVIWGPVYAKDIPVFVRRNFKKSFEMNKVEFPFVQRIEMAVMWACPFSVIASIIVFPFNYGFLLPLNILIWGWSFLLFIFFPVYSKWLVRNKKTTNFSKFTIVFDFSRIPIILWVIFLFFFISWNILFTAFNWGFVIGWSLVSFAILLIINIDLMGSTPIYKSGLHEDRLLRISLDEEKCQGAGFCEQVCPKNCFEVDHKQHMASIPRIDDCVQCGACIVQCPFDALHFESPSGEILTPESIREYKLNLIGKRLVKVD
ncbi:MAG TPA: HgcAB-like fusion protein [Balneolales bacterium]|nr:HgcAB-like fusion protein [Balneolales bacterium]